MSLYASLRKNPIIRILIPFIVGIIIASAYYRYLFNYLQIIKLIAFLCVAISLFLIFQKSELKLTDFFIHTTVFVVSLWLTLLNISVKYQCGASKIVIGKVIKEPEIKKNSILIQIKQLNTLHPVIFKPRINIYTNKDNQSIAQIQAGSILGIENTLKRIRNKGNPDEFDFERFQLSNRICYQTFSEIDDIVIIGNQSVKHSFTRGIAKIRRYVLHKINTSIKSTDTRKLVAALLIGNKSDLDQETIQSYTNAGVVHILAISGLHVGIIYMFLIFLLRFWDRKKSLRIFRTIIIVFVIWSYALLTGFSPSVSRAATMFSLFALGKLFHRDVSIFNLIAASAMLILLINPLLIFHVGFQLSYAAVAGIVFFVPLFEKWISFSYLVPDYFYKLFIVSLSAQLTTLPISLYYFNQFPTYFWLSNLLVIPVVFLIVISSILFISFSGIVFLSSFLGVFLEFLTKILNGWINFINVLPGSLLTNIRLSLPEALILIFVIWLFISWLKYAKTYHAVLSLIAICLFFVFNIVSNVSYQSKHQVIVYHTNKEIDIGLYSGDTNLFLSTSDDLDSRVDFDFYYKKHWLHRSIEDKIVLSKLDRYKTSGNGMKKIAIDSFALIKTVAGANFFVLTSNSRIILEQYHLPNLVTVVGENIFPPDSACPTKMIVIPACIHGFYANKWMRYASDHDIPCHCIAQKGAYIADI